MFDYQVAPPRKFARICRFTAGVSSLRRHISLLALTCVSLALAGCASLSPTDWQENCNFDGVVFTADFEGGRIDACRQLSESSFELRFDPENTPINHSAWYSFKVKAPQAQTISVHLTYSEHSHRYWPKLSADGEHWQRAGSGAVKVKENGGALIRLAVGSQWLWVSAQEVIDNALHAKWLDEAALHADFALETLGNSAQGRPIRKVESTAGTGRFIVLVGRQHPPEITGALAMQQFLQRLQEDDELARRFRSEFGIIAVPNMNPDGVASGNWRHNTQGIDLNRDWGPFTQPETQLLERELRRFLPTGQDSLFLFLDFHSTWHDVFYTHPAPADGDRAAADLTQRWLDHFAQDIVKVAPGYPVKIKPGHHPNKATSKTYVYKTYGIPAITFELGDETDRTFIDTYAATAAESMMRTLLNSIESPAQ